MRRIPNWKKAVDSLINETVRLGLTEDLGDLTLPEAQEVVDYFFARAREFITAEVIEMDFPDRED